jgi:hypothetical protein
MLQLTMGWNQQLPSEATKNFTDTLFAITKVRACGVYLWTVTGYRLLHSVVCKGTYFDRSFPLKPVVLEETIGIASTEEALMVSSPRPSDMEQADCKYDYKRMVDRYTSITELGSEGGKDHLCPQQYTSCF